MIKRRRFKQVESLEARCSEEARRLHEAASVLPPGPVRDIAVRKARQMDVASHMSEWLHSRGLRSPQ